MIWDVIISFWGEDKDWQWMAEEVKGTARFWFSNIWFLGKLIIFESLVKFGCGKLEIDTCCSSFSFIGLKYASTFWVRLRTLVNFSAFSFDFFYTDTHFTFSVHINTTANTNFVTKNNTRVRINNIK